MPTLFLGVVPQSIMGVWIARFSGLFADDGPFSHTAKRTIGGLARLSLAQMGSKWNRGLFCCCCCWWHLALAEAGLGSRAAPLDADFSFLSLCSSRLLRTLHTTMSMYNQCQHPRPWRIFWRRSMSTFIIGFFFSLPLSLSASHRFQVAACVFQDPSIVHSGGPLLAFSASLRP